MMRLTQQYRVLICHMKKDNLLKCFLRGLECLPTMTMFKTLADHSKSMTLQRMLLNQY